MIKKIRLSYTIMFTVMLSFIIRNYINAHKSSKNSAIGVQTIELYDSTRPGHHAPGAHRPVTIELWYPTKAPHSSQETNEIRNAEFYPMNKHFPLIMLSHGSNNNRRQYTWLTHYLVHQGYAVAAVDHHGNSKPTILPQYYLQPWDRALDITYALDYLTTGELAKHFDMERIGAIGYSFGGHTVMLLAGARMIPYGSQLDKLDLNAFINAQLPPQMIKEIIAGIDINKINQSYKDKRIKAICALAPVYQGFNNESIKAVTTPVLIVDAENDQRCPKKHHGDRYAQQLSPELLYDHLVIPDAGHGIFKDYAHQKHPHPQTRVLHNTTAASICQYFSTILAT